MVSSQEGSDSSQVVESAVPTPDATSSTAGDDVKVASGGTNGRSLSVSSSRGGSGKKLSAGKTKGGLILL